MELTTSVSFPTRNLFPKHKPEVKVGNIRMLNIFNAMQTIIRRKTISGSQAIFMLLKLFSLNENELK